MHPSRGKGALLSALHTSIQSRSHHWFNAAAPQAHSAVPVGVAARKQVIHRPLPAHQEAYQRGEQDQQGKPCFDQLEEITGQPLKAPGRCRRDFHAKRSINADFFRLAK